jgi:hypothetical protein
MLSEVISIMVYDFGVGTGSRALRAEVVDKMVHQIAERSYKFMQAVAVVPSSSWKNTFFREDPTILTGQTGNVVKGLPRGANFPQQSVKWEEVSIRIVKHGIEENIAWEDIISGDVNVQTRTVIKLTEAITKSVDDSLLIGLTDGFFSDSLAAYSSEDLRIQSYAITSSARGRWNESSAAIIDDLMTASRLIATKNYATNDLICFVSPRDKQSIMNYLAGKGAQFPIIAADITTNGTIGKVAGITLVESNSVPASYALVVKPKTVGTFKELVSLRSTTVEDPYKSLKIRVVQEGALELTDPFCSVLIKGTQGGTGL